MSVKKRDAPSQRESMDTFGREGTIQERRKEDEGREGGKKEGRWRRPERKKENEDREDDGAMSMKQRRCRKVGR
jgi:hypothetical protein